MSHANLNAYIMASGVQDVSNAFVDRKEYTAPLLKKPIRDNGNQQCVSSVTGRVITAQTVLLFQSIKTSTCIMSYTLSSSVEHERACGMIKSSQNRSEDVDEDIDMINLRSMRYKST